MSIIPQSSIPAVKDYSRLDLRADVDGFLELRVENDGSGNPIYFGRNKQPNADTASETWYITKNYYDGSGNFLRQQLPDGGPRFAYAWDDRATLFS